MLLQNKSLLIISVFALAVSCTKVKHKDPAPCHPSEPDEICDYWMPSAGLTSISGPTIANVGQSVQLNVGATGGNGCSDAAQIAANTNGSNITLTGNVHYHGCICTQQITEEMGTYIFTPTQAGTYTFQGTTYEGAPIVHTIVVQYVPGN